MGVQYNDDLIAEVIDKIQVHVFPRRLRAREYFVDFDPLRCGRCTTAHFSRALDMMGVKFLSEADVQALWEHYIEHGSNVQHPQVVNYVAFCKTVDEVFSTGGPNQAQMSSSPSMTMMMTFTPNTVEDEDRVMHLLHRVAVLCKTRGVTIKECYTDFERAAIASPSRPNPRRGGKVTKPQFLRLFPFRKEFSPEEKELLCERYKTKEGDIHFMMLHNDTMDFVYHEGQPFPQSTLVLKPDGTEWSHQSLHSVDKLRAKVVEKRVRVHESFQDFDPLRKGFCTVGQLKSVLTMLDLSKYLDRNGFEELVNHYMRSDGLFCYQDLCKDLSQDFTKPNLENSPLEQLSMPDPSHTAKARRSRMRLTSGTQEKVQDLAEKLRYQVRTRRMLLMPVFQDFDFANRGYVTRTQFARCMDMLGFGLDEVSIALLCGVYCDYGNHHDVNYKEFIRSVDPRPEDQELAMSQAQSPHLDFVPSRYFDHRGQVDGRAIPA